MTSDYRREHIKSVTYDEFDSLSEDGRSVITNAAAFFEGIADTDETPIPSAGQKLALRRAMARFVIDSGIATTRGWI